MWSRLSNRPIIKIPLLRGNQSLPFQAQVRSLKTATSYKSSVVTSSRPVKKAIGSTTTSPSTIKPTTYTTRKPVSSAPKSTTRYATTTSTRTTRAKASTSTSSTPPPPTIDPSIFEPTPIPSSSSSSSSSSAIKSTSKPRLAATTSTASTSPTAASTSTSTPATDNDIPTELSKSNAWTEFDDSPLDEGVENGENWTKSFRGLGSEPFSQQVTDTLLADLKSEEVEITPDGLLFLPEIRYRRVLNRAFGPGGWGLAPRSKTLVTAKSVSREYALVCHGRLVALARGEQDYFDPNGITTAMEGCKSNAMMRCCKDLGIASELWDPVFIRNFKSKYCEQKYFEKKRRMVWKRKDREWEYPYK